MNPDLIRVRHMYDAVREALSFVKGKTKAELQKDRVLSLAIVKTLEIIGEAATKVTAEFREQHPEIPWLVIVATRHRLIHGYFDIDLDIIWDTLKRDIPELSKNLKKLLSR